MSYGPLDFAAQSVSFGEIAVGALYEIRHNLTQQDVHSFSALTDDFNPVHVDRDFARLTFFWKTSGLWHAYCGLYFNDDWHGHSGSRCALG